MYRALIILIIFFPMIATAQDRIQSFTTGPQNLRKYIVSLKHNKDSISHKQAAEARLRTFFGSTIYEFKDRSVVIFQGEGPEELINACSRDTAKAKPFVKFVANKVIYFFCLPLYLPAYKNKIE